MISICLPSRGRPDLAIRMIETALQTVSNKSNVEFLFYLNDDDITLEKYKNLLNEKYYEIGPNQSTCFSWNQLAFKSKGDIVMLAGDDIQFLTKNWDKEVEKIFDSYEDKICMVIPWDCNKKGKGYQYKDKNEPVKIKDESIGAPHFFVHKNWIKALGYFAPPFFWHWYVDTYTQKVSRKLDRCIFLPYVKIKAKKIFDETSVKVRKNLNINLRDDFVWKTVRDRHVKIDVDELKKFIDDFQK